VSYFCWKVSFRWSGFGNLLRVSSMTALRTLLLFIAFVASLSEREEDSSVFEVSDAAQPSPGSPGVDQEAATPASAATSESATGESAAAAEHEPQMPGEDLPGATGDEPDPDDKVMPHQPSDPSLGEQNAVQELPDAALAVHDKPPEPPESEIAHRNPATSEPDIENKSDDQIVTVAQQGVIPAKIDEKDPTEELQRVLFTGFDASNQQVKIVTTKKDGKDVRVIVPMQHELEEGEEEVMDCFCGVKDAETLWTEEKKKFCCEEEGKCENPQDIIAARTKLAMKEKEKADEIVRQAEAKEAEEAEETSTVSNSTVSTTEEPSTTEPSTTEPTPPVGKDVRPIGNEADGNGVEHPEDKPKWAAQLPWVYKVAPSIVIHPSTSLPASLPTTTTTTTTTTNTFELKRQKAKANWGTIRAKVPLLIDWRAQAAFKAHSADVLATGDAELPPLSVPPLMKRVSNQVVPPGSIINEETKSLIQASMKEEANSKTRFGARKMGRQLDLDVAAE